MTRAEKQPVPHNKSVHRQAGTGPAADSFDVDNPVGDYLHKLQKIPLLTEEQERNLAQTMDAGKHARQQFVAEGARLSPKTRKELIKQSDVGFAARDELIKKNLRLVVSVAKKYQGRGVPFLDLIQEGNVGLMHATKKFDVTRHFKFSTYATWWIRQAVLRAIADQGRTIRTPVYAGDVTHKIMNVSRQLTQELGREPTPEEIAVEFPDLSAKKVEYYLEKNRTILSLQQPTDEDGDIELGETIQNTQESSPDSSAINRIMKEQLMDLLHSLPQREAQVLDLRYGLIDEGEGLSQEETGQMMGITRKEVKLLEAHALARLYNSYDHEILKDILIPENEETTQGPLLSNAKYAPRVTLKKRYVLNEAQRNALPKLPPREARVLEMRYSNEDRTPTFEEIGQRMGMSRQCVQQMEKRALWRLDKLTLHNDK